MKSGEVAVPVELAKSFTNQRLQVAWHAVILCDSEQSTGDFETWELLLIKAQLYFI